MQSTVIKSQLHSYGNQQSPTANAAFTFKQRTSGEGKISALAMLSSRQTSPERGTATPLSTHNSRLGGTGQSFF